MIVDAILVALMGMAELLMSLFPEDEVDWPDADWLPAFIGEYIGPFDAVGPFSESATVLALLVGVALPILIAVRVSLFVWFLLPVVK